MQHQGYSVAKIAEVVDGEVFGNDKGMVIRNLLTDSRQLATPEGTLFFAIVTQRNNGHKYIEGLYGNGVRAFVVDTLPANASDMGEAVFLKVDNTLAALQKIAAFHRRQFSIPVIGITGSNGKTVVKEWLAHIFEHGMSVVRNPKSYNSQIGVPLSVWQMDKQHDIAIFEAGISEPDEMEKLQAIIRPTIGIFTNIGQAHSENFIKTEQKVGEKLKLFTKVDKLVYCLDHSDIKAIMRRSEMLPKSKVFVWSKSVELADLFVKSVRRYGSSTKLVGVYNGKEISICIPFTDKASIENAIHCWATALLIGMDNDKIAESMKTLAPVAMRMELKSGMNNCTIINDSYSSDVNSLSIAIDFMNQQQHADKTLILSDVLQSGQDENELYSSIADLVSKKGITTFIGIGDVITRHSKLFAGKTYFYPDSKTFLSKFPLSTFANQTILLKGARVFEFEQISRELQEKAHETVLEVNLNNLVHNMNYYKSKLNPQTKLMVMVKAFGYGSGNFEVSNVLQFHHADYLTVAFADEGVELRKAGITLPIMVMSPEENSFETIIRYNLEPEIYSFRELQLLEKNIADSGITYPINIHVKIDSGMHRLGFTETEIPELIKRIKGNPLLHTQSIFSHLAAADNSAEDEFTLGQIAMFDRLSMQIQSAFDYKILRHILNTAGISRFTNYQFDMVRLGIGIYGVAAVADDQKELKTVVSLKSSITQIKEIEQGETVGYNRHGVIRQKTRIGTVPIGYADGLSRALGNGKGVLWVNDQPAPIVGDVCMDMCMIDITGIKVDEGGTVVVFDERHTVNEIAKAAGTIPYEILTRISQRVKRIYFQE